ncbi:MAG: chemotaxis protein CheA [Thermoanaerobaculia bacterium]
MVNEELRELLDDFLLEAEERLTRIEVSLLTAVDASAKERRSCFREVRRELHTLKGNSGMMGFTALQALAHELEDRVDQLDPEDPDLAPLFSGLDRFKQDLGDAAQVSQAPAEAEPGAEARAPAPVIGERRTGSTRVRIDHLDQLLETSTRLVISRHTLRDRIEHGASLEADRGDFVADSLRNWHEAEEAQRKLDRVLDLLQEQIRDLRTIPLKSVFSRLQRLVHDEAKRNGKEVQFLDRGGNTPLDTSLSELATDTLGHLIRNAIVHGLESPEEREQSGKPQLGTVLLEASLRAGDVEIEVFDDGAGIDESALRRAARRAGVDEIEATDLHALLFHPGLTTREKADQSAGRGMGLSAVLAAVHQHGGTIEVDTAIGVGTRFCLRLPLTVAVTDALLVGLGEERFAIPITAVRDTGSSRTLEEESIDLKQFLDLPLGGNQAEFYVTVEAEGRTSNLRVDDLGKIERIVVNPLDDLVGHPKGIVGSTVLGDGRVVLILDPPQLAASGTQESGAQTGGRR